MTCTHTYIQIYSCKRISSKLPKGNTKTAQLIVSSDSVFALRHNRYNRLAVSSRLTQGTIFLHTHIPFSRSKLKILIAAAVFRFQWAQVGFELATLYFLFIKKRQKQQQKCILCINCCHLIRLRFNTLFICKLSYACLT